MPKVLIFALAGVFISGTTLAGGGGFGFGSCLSVVKSEKTATSTPASTTVGTPSATTAQTPIPKTTKPESKG